MGGGAVLDLFWYRRPGWALKPSNYHRHDVDNSLFRAKIGFFSAIIWKTPAVLPNVLKTYPYHSPLHSQQGDDSPPHPHFHLARREIFPLCTVAS